MKYVRYFARGYVHYFARGRDYRRSHADPADWYLVAALDVLTVLIAPFFLLLPSYRATIRADIAKHEPPKRRPAA